MRHAYSLSLALCAAAALAACGGGGGGTSGAQNGLPPGTPSTGYAPNSVSMTIKIPAVPSATSSAKRGQYVSSGTQSIGVVVTNQGTTPSPAQYMNVSTCPQVNNVTTCTVSVAANPGNDVFTISAYSGTNGSGSVLSTGSITATILAGVANTTMPVTMGGVVSSISITPGTSTLPLGQSTTLNVVAKDASGAAIVGTYDNALSLSGSNLTFSSTSLTNSNDASHVTIAWKLGFSASTASTVSATADGQTGTTSITPGTGFAFYQTGTNSATDEVGFKMIAGSNGKLYYTSLGPLTCGPNGLCQSTTGAVHQFDPATSTDTEIALQSEGVGLRFTSDGALWIAGGPAPAPSTDPYIYRMAPGSFSSGALTPIPVPTANPNKAYMIRDFAEDGSGNLWFQDTSGGRFLKIPVAGPYTSTSITAYALPTAPPTTATHNGPRARNIEYASGVLMIPDFMNGIVDVVNPSTAAVTGQYVTNMQQTLTNGLDSSSQYDATNDGTAAYLSQTGNWNAAEPVGDVEKFDPSTNTFTTLPIVTGPVAVTPGASSINGTNLYFQDLSNNGLQLFDLSTSKGRLIPLAMVNGSGFDMPNGVAAIADGTAWFSCYASAQVFQPLCIGHTVYLSGWSVFPNTSITLNGAGMQSAQIMGIMESPSANSGPFTVASGNTSVCTIANASDHNFTIVGVSAGACTVTVKDKNNVTSSINVTVTTTTGTVQAKHLGGIK